MFSVYFTNHRYFASRTFGSVAEAADYARSTTFDSTIYSQDGEVVASYTFFGGLHVYPSEEGLEE